MSPSLLGLLALYTCASVSALVFIKLGAAHEPWLDPNNLASAWRLALGCALYVGSFAVWIFILRRADLTVVFPLSIALTLAGTTAAGVLVFNEPVTLPRVAGAAIILLGAVIVTR